MQPYEVIKANSAAEAALKSKFKVGYYVRVIAIETISNSDGSYSVFPIVEVENGS